VPHLEVLQPVPRLRLQLHDDECAAVPSLLSIGSWLLQHNLAALQLGVVQVSDNDLFLSLATLANLTSLSLSLQEAPGCSRAFLNIASLSSLGKLQELAVACTTKVMPGAPVALPLLGPCAAAGACAAAAGAQSSRSARVPCARPAPARSRSAAAALPRAPRPERQRAPGTQVVMPLTAKAVSVLALSWRQLRALSLTLAGTPCLVPEALQLLDGFSELRSLSITAPVDAEVHVGLPPPPPPCSWRDAGRVLRRRALQAGRGSGARRAAGRCEPPSLLSPNPPVCAAGRRRRRQRGPAGGAGGAY
jgi:hypothetical protein